MHREGDRRRVAQPVRVTVSYANNTNAGTATACCATYAGDANHSGIDDAEDFTIDKATSSTTISCPANVTFDGARRRLALPPLHGAGGLQSFR